MTGRGGVYAADTMPFDTSVPPDPPLRVLFVCTANICRSAFAHVVARSWAQRNGWPLEVASAGTHGWSAAPMDEAMAAEAVARGFDPAPFRSRPVTHDLVRATDLVVTMASEHRDWVLQDWPGAVAKVVTFGQLERACEATPGSVVGRELVGAIRQAGGRPDPGDDVVDPYRRGAEAARRCADDLVDRLERTVPRIAGVTR